MSSVESGGSNNLSWRVSTLEREVRDLKAGRPDVVADRVDRLSRELGELRKHVDKRFDDLERDLEQGDKANRDDLETQKRILIGAWVTIATGLVVAFLLGGSAAG